MIEGGWEDSAENLGVGIFIFNFREIVHRKFQKIYSQHKKLSAEIRQTVFKYSKIIEACHKH